MITSIIKSRLLFFWVASFVIAAVAYALLWLLMPGHHVFGSMYRMIGYHHAFPLQYIAIPYFFYGIFATLFSKYFKGANSVKTILTTLLIVILTILFSAPLGGMLWCFHDMQAGFFPDNWITNMISIGFIWGLEIGWYIIVLSIPYNILGILVCFFLTKKGVSLYKNKVKIHSV